MFCTKLTAKSMGGGRGPGQKVSLVHPREHSTINTIKLRPQMTTKRYRNSNMLILQEKQVTMKVSCKRQDQLLIQQLLIINRHTRLAYRSLLEGHFLLFFVSLGIIFLLTILPYISCFYSFFNCLNVLHFNSCFFFILQILFFIFHVFHLFFKYSCIYFKFYSGCHNYLNAWGFSM